MDERFAMLATSPLFSKVTRKDFEPFVEWLAPIERSYTKGQTVVSCGSTCGEFGFVLTGELEGIKLLADGRRIPVTQFLSGSVFGDLLAFGTSASPVTITALQPSRVLHFSCARLRQTDCPVPAAQAAFTYNLLAGASEKYFELNRRLDLLLIKSLRSRIGAFLLDEAQRAKSNTFCIRFNRMQLSEYLCCDRSALCRELSRMKQEGILEFYRTSFRLLAPEKLSAALSCHEYI